MPAPVSCPALSVRCYTISFTAFNVRCHGAVFFPATKSIGFANRITRRWLSPMVQNFVVRPLDHLATAPDQVLQAALMKRPFKSIETSRSVMHQKTGVV